MGIFDKLKEIANKLTQSPEPFDPGIFNDEVAMKTEWTPAKGGGTNVGTHALKETGPARVEFKISVVGLISPGIFMLVGLGVGVGMTIGWLNGGEIFLLLFGVPFGSVFFLVGFFISRSWSKPRVFDKHTGFFWRGRREPLLGVNADLGQDHCRLNEIHAIQLLRDYCRSDKSSYFSYELNLVLHDHRRINVIDHGKLTRIRSDADRLAQFLSVPVWDAT